MDMKQELVMELEGACIKAFDRVPDGKADWPGRTDNNVRGFSDTRRCQNYGTKRTLRT